MRPDRRVRLTPMPPAELALWRASRRDSDEALPDPVTGEEQEALVVVVDGEPIGGVLIGRVEDAGILRCSVRAIETTLSPDAIEDWAEVLTVIGDHARDNGARTLLTSVRPHLVGLFEAVGYRATVTNHAKRLDGNPHFQEDRRVAVRPMDDDERRQFAADARQLLASGSERSPLLDPEDSPERIEARLARLTADPLPDDELLMVGTVEGRPVGRVWGMLVEQDGGLDYLGATFELFPEARGQRLTPSFLGAMARHLREIGVRDLYLRVDGHDHRARDSFLSAGIDINDVHLSKDLA